MKLLLLFILSFFYCSYSFASNKALDNFLKDLKSISTNIDDQDLEELKQILSYYSYIGKDIRVSAEKEFFRIIRKAHKPRKIALNRFKEIKSDKVSKAIESLNPTMQSIVKNLRNYYMNKDEDIQKALILYHVTKDKTILDDENLFNYIEYKPFLYYKKLEQFD